MRMSGTWNVLALVGAVCAGGARADTLTVPGGFETIQAAIDAAAPGDEILVAPGDYAEEITLLGKPITVRSEGGPDVTTLIGDGEGTVVDMSDMVGPDTLFEGFTITGGGGKQVLPGGPTIGGGMRIVGSPVIRDCLFMNNAADVAGALQGRLALIEDCTFIANESDRSAAVTASGAVVNCLFQDNFGPDSAALRLTSGGSALNSAFFGGDVAIAGGGADVEIIGCLLADATNGLVTDSAGTMVANCTFANLSATAVSGSGIQIVNSAFAGNGQDLNLLGGSVLYSIGAGLPADPTNIIATPTFLDPEAGDYRLAPASLGIDAADTNALPPDEFDLDDDGDAGEPLPVDANGDVRAIDDPNTPDSGLGFPPLDMGAFEFQPCFADCNGDGSLDVFDFSCFQEAFNDGDAQSADCNGDGSLDVFDFSCFQVAFNDGCP